MWYNSYFPNTSDYKLEKTFLNTISYENIIIFTDGSDASIIPNENEILINGSSNFNNNFWRTNFNSKFFQKYFSKKIRIPFYLVFFK